MNATTAETIPTAWIDERDVPFFRITAALFEPDYVLGASVLLASYDADAADATETARRAHDVRLTTAVIDLDVATTTSR